MIVGTTKPIKELIGITDRYKKILAVGCGTCITVCYAGGEKEVAVATAALRIARKIKGGELVTQESTIKRQCEWEFVEDLDSLVGGVDAILSFGCAAGIQSLADRYPNTAVLPGVNTQFIGMVQKQGRWEERCIGCGDCITHLTGGLCAVTRCPKGQLNESCGGETESGMCEVNDALECVWFTIAKRLKATGELEDAGTFVESKNWEASHSGGLRMIEKESMLR